MVTRAETEFIEVRPVEVTAGWGGKNHLATVVLEEVGGDGRLIIGMLKGEGDYIAMQLQGIESQRPMTYEFMAAVLAAYGGKLIEARISRQDGRTIYAEAVLDGPRGIFTIDARPSDVINLALRSAAPIRAAREVIVRAGS